MKAFSIGGLVVLFLCSTARADVLVASAYTPGVLRYSEQDGSFLSAFIPAGSGGLGVLEDMVFGPDGNLYLTSNSTDSVLRYDGQTGAFLNTFVASGSGGLDLPTGLVFGPDGNLYVSSLLNHSVLRYDGQTGAFLNAFIPAGGGGLYEPDGILFGSDGNLYVGSRNLSTARVLRYDQTGTFLGVFADTGQYAPIVQFTFGPDGNLYANDYYSDRVLRFSGGSGNLIDTFVASGAGGLDGPYGLEFSPDGRLYVSSFNHPSFASNAVLRYDGQTGAYDPTFLANGGGLHGPTTMLFYDAAHPVPEPASIVALALGLCLYPAFRRSIKPRSIL